jgi:hypothetical protein
MKKKGILTILGVAVLVFFLLLTTVSAVLGVPCWFIFRNIKTLQIAEPPSLIIDIYPETPVNIGQTITITVTNSSTGLPVENATVYISKDNYQFEKYTDTNGKTNFEFIGDVMVVYADAPDIKASDYSAIPKTPVGWVQNYQTSMISAAFGGLISALATFLFQRSTTKKIKINNSKPKSKISRKKK